MDGQKDLKLLRIRNTEEAAKKRNREEWRRFVVVALGPKDEAEKKVPKRLGATTTPASILHLNGICSTRLTI